MSDEPSIYRADETLAASERSARSTDVIVRGAVIGRYVVLSELGRGGMGVVYAAFDPELDRKVALKLLHTDIGSEGPPEEGHRRLLREAQAMAKLAHPNVITVHDVGTHQGRVFVAMEFVEGETLGHWLEQDRHWSEVLDTFVRAGHGLAAAHHKGLEHRDFKPDNVMVGSDCRVRVMDFGLARPTERSERPGGDSTLPPLHVSSGQNEPDVVPSTDALGTELTKHGRLMGTPAYMAPEQHLMRASDARTDQFSFCVALWEGLYGERPFAGETLAALSFNVTQGKVRGRPSGTKVPGWVEPILVRGLAIDPGERWPELAALLGALARGASRRRRRTLTLAAGAALIGGFAVLGGWQLEVERRRTTCRSEAGRIAEVWNDETKARLREALTGTGITYAASTFEHAVPFLDDHVAKWRERFADLCVATEADGIRSDELWAASRHCLEERRGELASLLDVLIEYPDAASVQRTVMAVAGLGRVEPCADDTWLGRNAAPPPGAGPTDEARPKLWRALAMGGAGQYEQGLELAREVVAATSGRDSVRLRARALQAAGRLAGRAGAYPQAEKLLREAFDLTLRSGEDDLALASAIGLVLTVGRLMARHEEGHLWAVVAQGLHARVSREHDLAEASLQSSLGAVFESQGHYLEAERALARALSILERTLGPEHPQVGDAYNNLGLVYRLLQNRNDEAERALLRARSILDKSLGADHPQVASSHGNLGLVYRAQGRQPEAERALERALSILQEGLGPDHPSVASTYNNLGGVYQSQGRYREAERAHQKALLIKKKALGPDHPSVATSSDNLGSAYQRQGRHEEAERAHKRALSIREQALGPDHPDLAMSHGNLGIVYAAQGRYEEATLAFEKALSIDVQVFGPDHPRVAISYKHRGDVHRLQGQHARAERAYRRALSIWEKALGRDHSDLAPALVGLAEVRLELGRVDAALPDAERAFELCTTRQVAPVQLAEATFVLARAQWQAGGDRDRARALAEQARDAYSEAGDAYRDVLDDVQRWLAKRAGAR